jgi:hypothetical protein
LGVNRNFSGVGKPFQTQPFATHLDMRRDWNLEHAFTTGQTTLILYNHGQFSYTQGLCVDGGRDIRHASTYPAGKF